MQTVLITGANGFTGSHLKDLLKGEFNLVCTGTQPPENDPFLFYEMDITRPAEIKEVFEKVKPPVIVHLAALSKPDECEANHEKAYTVNTKAVEYLLAAAAAYRSHFIFLSTDFVFDGKKGMYKEEDPPSPVNFYGQTKLMAEELVKKYLFDWTIIRTVLVYGKTIGRENIITRAAKALQKEEEIKIVNDQVRTPTYVGDLCKAIQSVIELNAKGVYHISGKDVLTPYEMVKATAAYLELDKSLVKPVSTASINEPARRPLKTGFDISKAKNELGYEPVSFEEGLILSFNNKPDSIRQ